MRLTFFLYLSLILARVRRPTSTIGRRSARLRLHPTLPRHPDTTKIGAYIFLNDNECNLLRINTTRCTRLLRILVQWRFQLIDAKALHARHLLPPLLPLQHGLVPHRFTDRSRPR